MNIEKHHDAFVKCQKFHDDVKLLMKDLDFEPSDETEKMAAVLEVTRKIMLRVVSFYDELKS